jgi:hypothetical protein
MATESKAKLNVEFTRTSFFAKSFFELALKGL